MVYTVELERRERYDIAVVASGCAPEDFRPGAWREEFDRMLEAEPPKVDLKQYELRQVLFGGW